MGAVHQTAPSSLLPRQRIGLAVHVGMALALVPAFAWLAPASSWADPLLLATLVGLAIVTDRHEVPLPSGVGFDALLALMLIAVATAGPLPALVLMVAPWAVNVATGREPPLRAGALANLAGYGWQAITAALVLQVAGGAGSVGALFAAGTTLYVVGWAAGPAVYATLWLGRTLRDMVRTFVDVIPAGAVMVVLGTVTVALLGAWGLPALALFAVIAILPQSALTYAARTRPIARLAPDVATRRYATALGVQLGLPYAQRRHISAVARQAERNPASGDPMDYVAAGLGSGGPVVLETHLTTEWWDGGGSPAGLQGPVIPLAARTVAVARTWSELTAAGGPELSHRDALEHLRAVAGRRLDPDIVKAAAAVVAQERMSAQDLAPEPRLHRLGVPRRLREALAASA